MIFYGHDHDEIYHKTRRELDQERLERNPMIFDRKTSDECEKLEDFV
ncbi:MAG: hypothetical protein IIA83_00770 [Thaumarchaeota archaeon]|nr:hypothetical protein [Nitrososphaerota archaeon]